MRNARLTPLIAGAAAVVAMGALTAGCATDTKEEPATVTPAPTSSAPVVSPTEKAVGPGGSNSFSPTINPTPPGAVCRDIVNGVCIR